MKRTAALLASALLGAGLVPLWTTEGSDSALLRPDDAEFVAAGRRVYDVQCASCHGATLEGQPDWMQRDADGYLPAPPHDETGHTWHHPDAVLFELTRDGLASAAGADYSTRMPAFGDVIPDEAILQALSYIKSRWPEEIRERHDAMNARVGDRG